MTSRFPLAIFPMQRHHLDVVMALEHLSFPTPWPRSLYERELSCNDYSRYFVIAKRRNVVPQPARTELSFDSASTAIGYGGFWRMEEEAHIVTVAVHPQWRGKELGRWLMLNLVTRARDAGAELVTLEVRPSNEPALRLYESLGFVQIGMRKRYYPNGESALLYELTDLASPDTWRPLQDDLARLDALMASGVQATE